MSHLIFDVGMHKGEDTEFYLRSGYRVVAIDADVNLVEKARAKYADYAAKDKFKVLNYAISNVNDETVTFHISKESVWNSLKTEIAERRDTLDKEVQVRTKLLSKLFEEYGVPHYCKIDIEGYDNICLQTLMAAKEKPAYISVESECLAEGEVISNEEALNTLISLQELGYSKFKLVDQKTLSSLTLDDKFYFPGHIRMFKKIFPKKSQREKYKEKFNYEFLPGATGPFGEEIEGEWMNFEKAKRTLVRHRTDYFKLGDSLSFGFWCDWHAAM